MRTPVNTWTCMGCGNTGSGGKPPHFIPDPKQPVPGTRIGVCEACYRASRAKIEPHLCWSKGFGRSVGDVCPACEAERTTTAARDTP